MLPRHRCRWEFFNKFLKTEIALKPWVTREKKFIRDFPDNLVPRAIG